MNQRNQEVGIYTRPWYSEVEFDSRICHEGDGSKFPNLRGVMEGKITSGCLATDRSRVYTDSMKGTRRVRSKGTLMHQCKLPRNDITIADD